jgi:hypothetical protein
MKDRKNTGGGFHGDPAVQDVPDNAGVGVNPDPANSDTETEGIQGNIRLDIQDHASPDPAVQDVPDNAEKPDSQPCDNPPDTATGMEGNKTPNLLPAETAVVTSESRKGKTIVAVTGKPITFDSEGRATASMTDALYLKDCPGFAIG